MPPIEPSPYWCVIGGGNMARAIVERALARGVMQPDRCVIAEPDPEKRTHFESRRIKTAPDAAVALARAAESDSPESVVILLAIKPQVLPQISADVATALGSLGGTAVLSILAGTTTATLEHALGANARVVRAMPNLPAQIGLGVSAVCAGRSATSIDLNAARALLSSVGEIVDLDESHFDAFTALAGSGPAYLFYLAEALSKAAEELGLPPDLSDRVTRQMLLGSATLLERDAEHSAQQLRAAVTSRGGTTAAATAVLDAHGFLAIWSEALRAARQRGRELNAPPTSPPSGSAG